MRMRKRCENIELMSHKGAIGDKGLSTQEITAEFNKILGKEYTIFTVGAKIGRLAAKKLIIGRPKAGDAGVTLYSLPN